MAKINISVDKNGDLLIENNYSGVGFKSDSGEEFAICNRDTGFEFKYNNVWYEAKNGELKKLATTGNSGSSGDKKSTKQCPECGYSDDIRWHPYKEYFICCRCYHKWG